MERALAYYLSVIAMALLPVAAMSAQDVWDGTIATEFAGGTGTADDPYLISTGDELAYLAQITNADYSVTQGKYYQLTNDIVLNENVLNDDFELNGTPAHVWTPIAHTTNRSDSGFSGDFDGNGHVVSGLYLQDSPLRELGLFGSVDHGGIIHDLSIVDAYMESSYTCGLVVGGIYNNGQVVRCYASGKILGGTLEKGMIAGWIYYEGKVEHCYAYGAIDGISLTGGLLGGSYASDESVSNNYCVVKLASGSYGVISEGGCINSYYDSTVSPDAYAGNAIAKTTEEMQSEAFAQLLGEPFVYVEGNYPYIKGLSKVGENEVNISGNKISLGTLTNGRNSTVKFYREYDGMSVKKGTRYADAGTTVYVKVTPGRRLKLTDGCVTVVNAATNQNIEATKVASDIYSFTMPDAEVTVSVTFTDDSSKAYVWDGTIATEFAGGTGTKNDPYLISTGDELAYLAQLTMLDASQTSGKYYKLTSDIVLNEDVLTEDYRLNGTPEHNWIPIGDPENTSANYPSADFAGDFDGNGYTISGLYCNTEYHMAGLFGSVSGSVHDLAVIDSYVYGGNFTGIIVGSTNQNANTSIARCYAEGFVGTFGTSVCYSGVVAGHVYYGTMQHCYANGRVENSYAAGGVLGWQDYHGSSSDCFSAVYGTLGAVGGGSSTYTNMYFDQSMVTSSDYGTGKTTAEMQAAEFAALLGSPFVYDNTGNYPYIEGLPRAGENNINMVGNLLSVGTLTNGGGSSIKFYSEYDGSKLNRQLRREEAGQTVYMKLNLRRNMFLTDGSLMVVNDETGATLTLTSVAENIWSFIMPESSVTVSAALHRDPNMPSVWDGTVALAFAEGDGSAEDPYKIYSGDELAYLAQLTNANGALTKGKYYELAADIYLNDQILNDNYELAVAPENVWMPIGTSYANSFQGTFDGKGHVISGTYIPEGSDVALFGFLNYRGTIQNLSVVDTYVAGSSVAGLVSHMAYNDSSWVRNCYVEAALNGSSGYYAGVVCCYQYAYGVIENCYASGIVQSGYYPAGIVSYYYNNDATVRNCFSAVKGAYAIGNTSNSSKITNVYADEDLGKAYSPREDNSSKYTIEMHTPDFATRIGAPFEFVLGNYPYIPGLLKIGENRGWTTPADPTHGGEGGTWDGATAITFAGGTGTEADPYIINNGAQLAYLAKLTNANANLTKGKYYRLAADITLNEDVLTDNMTLNGTPQNVWEPIGKDYTTGFQGVFDGNSYTIAGAYVPEGTYAALFGAINNGARIHDVSLVDTYVNGEDAGGLVGMMAYSDSCYISKCFVEAVVNGSSYAGALVSYMYSYTSIDRCYTAGKVSANSYAGGISAYNHNGYAKVTNCYSTVQGGPAFGYSYGYSNIKNVYYDRERSGATSATTYRDDYRSVETTEMLSTDFAARMGEPFEYCVGYYPYIYGMHKIDKNGKVLIVNGYALRIGTLTGAEDCGIDFYRTYTKKTQQLDDQVTVGSKVFVNGTMNIYAKVTPATGKRLSNAGLVIKDSAGNTIEATEIANDLYQFTMSERALTVSAKFVLGGYCGNPEVNDGRNVLWQLSDDKSTLTIDGTGDMVAAAWTTYANTVETIVVEEGVTNVAAQAFKDMNKATTLTLPSTIGSIGANAFDNCTAAVDMRQSTLLMTLHAGEFSGYSGTTVYLPATITMVEANTFSDASVLKHVYFAVESDEVLLANGTQVYDEYGQADIASFVIKDNTAVVLTREVGYLLSADDITGDNCSLQFYSDAAASIEIPIDTKVLHRDDAPRIYIKALASDARVLFVDGISVLSADGQALEVIQEAYNLFSFAMPAENVSVGAQFIVGGYCGNTSVNGGYNLAWTYADGTLQFLDSPVATGLNREMANMEAHAAPWQAYATEIEHLDLGNTAFIGNNAFADCAALPAIELTGAPAISVGSNAFNAETFIIVDADQYATYVADAQWGQYADQTVPAVTTINMNAGQRWTTVYSMAARMLPAGVTAYTITDIEVGEAVPGEALNYIPAGTPVLIEHTTPSAAIAAEARTSEATCKMSTAQLNLLEWSDQPRTVRAREGYTLYRDEFVMVSSGTLPAGVVFLPANSSKATHLTIGDETADAIVTPTEEDSEVWYTLEGKRSETKPVKPGLYIRGNKKVMVK